MRLILTKTKPCSQHIFRFKSYIQTKPSSLQSIEFFSPQNTFDPKPHPFPSTTAAPIHVFLVMSNTVDRTRRKSDSPNS